MAWILLVLAGLFEVAWATGLKYTEGFTRLWPSVWTLGTMAISFWLLALAVKNLPIGSAYSIWVGIGAVGTVIVGILRFGESFSLLRLLSVLLIIVGIIGVKLSSEL